MTVAAWRQTLEQRLAAAGVEETALEADMLLAQVLGCTVAQLRLRRQQELTDFQARRLERMICRRETREPLQYILGQWEFFGLSFAVGPGVLIPRQDTEVLVEAALEYLKQHPRAAVLDLCAGSGAIAVAVAKHAPAVKVTALEKNDPAYFYTIQNIGQNKAYTVEAVRGDLFDGPGVHRYDLVLSNPPYIPAAEVETLMPEVRREPAAALDGGPDGLTFYRAICDLWVPAVNPGGAVMVEVGIGQAQSVADLFRDAGLQDVSIRADYGGVDRVVSGFLTSDT